MIDFKRLRWIMKHIPDAAWEIEKKEAAATRITSVLTGMPRGDGGNHQEEKYISLIETKDAYREILSEFDAILAELTPMINDLEDPTEKAFMRLRYLYGHKPETIAARYHYSRSSVFAYLTRAERRIAKQSQNA